MTRSDDSLRWADLWAFLSWCTSRRRGEGGAGDTRGVGACGVRRLLAASFCEGTSDTVVGWDTLPGSTELGTASAIAVGGVHSCAVQSGTGAVVAGARTP